MLELKHISKHFPGFSLDAADLTVKEGECLALMGRSGSGKSLLLKIIAGIEKQDNGSIYLDNRDISHSKIQHRNCILMPQDSCLFPHLSVMDNIAYPLRSRGIHPTDIKKRVEVIAEKLEVTHLMKRKPAKLSGGEAQRVALARALAFKPSVLLLDEPLNALDLELRDGMIGLLLSIRQEGQTMMLVTHQLEEAQTLAQKMAVLDHGRMVQSGVTEEVIRHPECTFLASKYSCNIQST
jgi:ABC-type sugar transport system ATPase subunit